MAWGRQLLQLRLQHWVSPNLTTPPPQPQAPLPHLPPTLLLPSSHSSPPPITLVLALTESIPTVAWGLSMAPAWSCSSSETSGERRQGIGDPRLWGTEAAWRGKEGGGEGLRLWSTSGRGKAQCLPPYLPHSLHTVCPYHLSAYCLFPTASSTLTSPLLPSQAPPPLPASLLPHQHLPYCVPLHCLPHCLSPNCPQ